MAGQEVGPHQTTPGHFRHYKATRVTFRRSFIIERILGIRCAGEGGQEASQVLHQTPPPLMNLLTHIMHRGASVFLCSVGLLGCDPLYTRLNCSCNCAQLSVLPSLVLSSCGVDKHNDEGGISFLLWHTSRILHHLWCVYVYKGICWIMKDLGPTPDVMLP